MPFDHDLWTQRQTRWGQQIRWFRQEFCSCFNPQTQEWDRTHAVCEGTGQVSTEQDVSIYKAILANTGIQMETDGAGRIIDQALVVETFRDEIPIEEGDEIIPHDPGRYIHSQEVLRRGIDDSLFYPFSECISCRRNSTFYTAGTDFNIAEHGREVVWVEGHGPATGEQYSILYVGTPRYHVHRTLRRGYSPPTQAAWCRLKQPEEHRQGIGD